MPTAIKTAKTAPYSPIFTDISPTSRSPR
jgi:hypothetical protein